MSRVSRPAQPRRSADVPAASAGTPGRHWPFGEGKPAEGNAAGAGDDPALAVVQRTVSAADAGAHKPAGAVASAFDAGQQAKAAAAKPRPRAAPIDLASIVIEDDVPVTRRIDSAAQQLRDSCLALLQRMQPGQSTVLPRATGQALVRIARKAQKAVKRRELPDGTWRVWREKDPAPAAQGAPAGTGP